MDAQIKYDYAMFFSVIALIFGLSGLIAGIKHHENVLFIPVFALLLLSGLYGSYRVAIAKY